MMRTLARVLAVAISAIVALAACAPSTATLTPVTVQPRRLVDCRSQRSDCHEKSQNVRRGMGEGNVAG